MFIEFISALGTFLVFFFGAIFTITWLVWPVNDVQENAPAWVMARGIKSVYSRIKYVVGGFYGWFFP